MSLNRSTQLPHRLYLWIKIPMMVIVAVMAFQSWRINSLRATEQAASGQTPAIKGKPIRSRAATNTDPNVVQVGLVKADAAAVPAQPIAAGVPGFAPVTFNQLASFAFEVSDAIMTSTNQAGRAEDQIPSQVKAYKGKAIALTGFMLPLRVEGGRVTELLLMRDQSMCCYGKVPKMNEWVAVTMKDKGVKPILDEPVTLLGTLEIGEKRENGYLSSIYRMVGERLDDTVPAVKPTTSVTAAAQP